MNIYGKIITFFMGCAVFVGAVSCVKTDFNLGSDIIAQHEKFITKTINIPLDSIEMRMLSKISGYSTLRLTVGSIRDNVEGREKITRRASMVSLVPLADTIDWGTNPQLTRFYLRLAKDSIITATDDQKNILQNIRVYDLNESPKVASKDVPFDSLFVYTDDMPIREFDNMTPISIGTPLYGGGASFIIPLSETFANSIMGKGKEAVDSIALYTKGHPGIAICADDPINEGGRINFFKIKLNEDNTSSEVTDSYAELCYTTIIDGEVKDTSVLFALGATSFANSSPTYYAFNLCEEDYLGQSPAGKAEEVIMVDGGNGVKPVIRAEWLRNMLLETLAPEFETPMEEIATSERLIINRATINFPFEQPAGTSPWNFTPSYLNPTLRILSDDKQDAYYASITDASVSEENQGTVDVSRLSFHPDITHHLQQILSTSKDSLSLLEKENLWFLILVDETYVTGTTSSSSSDYYNQLAYMNYYNSLYGGYGYGSYGGYGYDNYSNYYMMQSYYNSMYGDNSSTTTTSTTTMMDKDRLYKLKLNGPKAAERRPYITITYSYMMGD